MHTQQNTVSLKDKRVSLKDKRVLLKDAQLAVFDSFTRIADLTRISEEGKPPLLLIVSAGKILLIKNREEQKQR